MPWRRVTLGFSASVLATTWIACTALFSFAFGETGFVASLLGLTFAMIGFPFAFFKAVYGGGLQTPEEAARMVPWVVGAVGVAAGLLFLFLKSSVPLVGVLSLFVMGILGFALWIVIVLRDTL